jgi:ATP-dependent helicase/nuclease subunit B
MSMGQSMTDHPAPTAARREAALIALLERGTTVITATRRLARRLSQSCELAQIEAGRAGWSAAPVYAWSHWLEQGLRQLGQRGLMPPLLATTQATALWQSVVAASPEAAATGAPAAATAALAQAAWEHLHEWQVPAAAWSTGGGLEAEVFARWAVAYRAALERLGVVDGPLALSLLPAAVRRQTTPDFWPQAVHFLGMANPSAATRAVAEALGAVGVRVSGLEDPVQAGRSRGDGWVQLALDGPEAECRAVADWARTELLAAPQSRLAVVVPGLSSRAHALARALDARLDPAGQIASAPAEPVYDLALAPPLSEVAAVRDALRLLATGLGPLPMADWSQLLRSPWLTGAEVERLARLQLDLRLRRGREPRPSMQSVMERSLTGAPLLGRALNAAAAHPFPDEGAAPSAWARVFSERLVALGWPGSDAVTSRVHQAVEAWSEMLERLAGLDAVLPVLTAAEALDWLRQLVAAQPFRPESPRQRLDVIPALELPGCSYDAVWIMGLTETEFPPPVRLAAFIPTPVAVRHGLKDAHSHAVWQESRAWLAAAFAAAPRGVVSFSCQVDGVPQAPSPLIADLPATRLDALRIASAPGLAESAFAGRRGAPVPDWQAPPVVAGEDEVSGFALADQAACPFRAWARHRLRATPLPSPPEGAEANDRGRWLHRALELLWRDIGDQSRLAAACAETRAEWIDRAVDQTLRDSARGHPSLRQPRFLALERARLRAVCEAWLVCELERPAFAVLACEQETRLRLSELTINLRLDRLDRLADGSLVVVDYKSGSVSLSGWFPPRTQDTQFALYALATAGPLAGVVAGLPNEKGGPRYVGITREAGLLPGCKLPSSRKWSGDFQSLLDAWQEDLTRLARAYLEGDASVTPFAPRKTCHYCELGSLCRIDPDLRDPELDTEDEDTESEEASDGWEAGS